jgi:hypothetical protein
MMEALTDEWFLRETIARAKAGDREAAIEAMRIAMAQLYANKLSGEIAFYLAQALEAVLDDPTGKNFVKVFNLEQEAQRPKSANAEDRSLRAALWVHLSVLRGVPLREAKAQAAELWVFANIDRELRKHTVTARDDGTDKWDEIFKAEGKPLPPRQ